MTGMLLADLGAEVVSIARPFPPIPESRARPNTTSPAANRRNLALDLKAPEGVACALDLHHPGGRPDRGVPPRRDGTAPGFARRSVMPRNPGLVYGRVTGWGQDGPLAQQAGHDLNYIALAGALSAIGPAGGAPVPPVNFLGDYAGGGLMLAFGMVCALLERSRSGPRPGGGYRHERGG